MKRQLKAATDNALGTEVTAYPDIHNCFEKARSAQRKQQRFYEEDCDPQFEIARLRECGQLYHYLIDRKFQAGREVLGLDLAGRTLLEICAGSGMMSEKFARAGAIVT